MKIFMISNMYPSKHNPTYGIFVKNFENSLISEGCEFPYKAIIGDRDKNLLKRTINYLYFFIKVITYYNNKDYDLIYVHYIAHSLLPFLFVRKCIHKPLVINAHGSDVFPRTTIGKLIQKIVTPIVKQADLIVVPSAFLKKNVEALFEINEKRIFVSPSAGINTELFRPVVPGKQNGIFTIGYVSRIEQGKGWDTLLNAIKILKEKGFDNYKVLVIGGGSKKGELFSMVQRNQLQDVVKLVGIVPHEELTYWYHRMDVFVFSTELPESLGLVGLEAMACGVPVIGSDIGALKDYIKDGINGQLFKPGDARQLALFVESFSELTEAKKKHCKSNPEKRHCNIILKMWLLD